MICKRVLATGFGLSASALNHSVVQARTVAETRAKDPGTKIWKGIPLQHHDAFGSFYYLWIYLTLSLFTIGYNHFAHVLF
jgi:hypothetical protein